MRYLNLIIFCFCFISSIAQEFSYKLKFEDAKGNKDSLILGYDVDATDGIDIAFGEENIINVTINPVFDIRISDEWEKRLYNSTFSGINESGTFHTKKSIVERKCGTSFSIFSIDIYAKHWPVTATWDSSKFDNECLKGSVFTGMTPGGWFDVVGFSDLYYVLLKDKNKVTFTKNWSKDANYGYGFVNNKNDTASHFWSVFSNDIGTSTSDFNLSNDFAQIFPNPFVNIVEVISPHFTEFELYNACGFKILESNLETKVLNLSHLPQGVYYLILKSKSKNQTFKISKI